MSRFIEVTDYSQGLPEYVDHAGEKVFVNVDKIATYQRKSYATSLKCVTISFGGHQVLIVTEEEFDDKIARALLEAEG